MSRFLPLPTSINAEGPTLLGPLPKYHTSSHISVDFVRFASPVSFRHVLRIFYLSGWSLGRGRCRVVNRNALFPCFVTPSTTSFSHFKESPTMDPYFCQPYTSLARYHLLAHENSQFRLSSVRCHQQPPCDLAQVPSAYKKGWLSVSSFPQSA